MVLSDDAIDVLASCKSGIGPVEKLVKVLTGQWTWMSRFTEELFAHLKEHRILQDTEGGEMSNEPQPQHPSTHEISDLTEPTTVDTYDAPATKRVRLSNGIEGSIASALTPSHRDRGSRGRGNRGQGGKGGRGRKTGETAEEMRKAFEAADDPRMAGLFTFSVPKPAQVQQTQS